MTGWMHLPDELFALCVLFTWGNVLFGIGGNKLARYAASTALFFMCVSMVFHAFTFLESL